MPRNRPNRNRPGKGKPEGATGNHPGRTPGKLQSQNQRLRKQLSKAKKQQERLVKTQRRSERQERLSVTDPLTPKRLRREVDASLDLRYNPELRQLKGQVRGSEHRSNTEIPAWYQDFQGKAAQAQQSTQAAHAGAQQNLNAAAMQGLQQQTGQMNQAQAQAQQQADVRGSQANAAPFAEGVQAAGAGYGQAIGQAGAIGAQGASAGGFLAAQQVVGAQKMLEALGSERNEKSKLKGEIRSVRRERGQAGMDLRRQLRGEERNWAAVAQEFGLDRAKAGADVADDRADNRRSDQAERRQGKAEKRQQRAERRQRARNKLLNRSTREDIKSKRAEGRLDRRADLADDGRRNFSTDYGEYAQRTRPKSDSDSNGGSGSGGDKEPAFRGRPTSVTPSEARENQTSWRKYVRGLRNGDAPPSSADPFLKSAAGKYIYWEQRGGKGVTSPKMQRILWRDYGIRVPVSPVSGKRSGKSKRVAPGPEGQGGRPT